MILFAEVSEAIILYLVVVAVRVCKHCWICLVTLKEMT
jgi:hypothetical protein